MTSCDSAEEEDTTTDPALDFLSLTFDPVKVLQTSPSALVLPHPSVQPCDNLQVYTSVVQGTRREPRPHTPMEPHPPAQPLERPRLKKNPKTVLDFMQRDQPGPFSLLQNCRRTGRRVLVAIRHCTGVRGVCEGVVVVYDRHMNLVLREVKECYTPFRTVANGGITLSKSQRQRRRRKSSKQGEGQGKESGGVATVSEVTSEAPNCASQTWGKWERCRTVKQLFIRGDNVIYITAAPQTNSES